MIVDSILDWRDADELHRLNRAESDYCLALPSPTAQERRLRQRGRVLQVRGMTREILYGRPESPGLAEYLTVWTRRGLNVNTVSAPVLRAVGLAGRRWASPGPPPLPRPHHRERPDPPGQPADPLGDLPHRGLGRSGQGRRTLVAVARVPGADGITRVRPLSWRWTARSRRGEARRP
jgi:hypothetical protein